MSIQTNQRGFSVVELGLILVAVGIIGFTGWHIAQAHKSVTSLNSKTAANNTSQAATNSTAPAVQNASDLTGAQATLDQTDPTTANSSDLNQLDSQLSGLN